MALVARFVVLAGCAVAASLPLNASAQSAGQDQRQRDLASSMVATAEMALDAWLAETVPAHYAERTVSSMSKNLADWISRQADDPNSGALPAFRRVEAALAQAQQAIRATDRPAAARSLAEIKSATAPAARGAEPQP
jgi:hypothetical protein